MKQFFIVLIPILLVACAPSSKNGQESKNDIDTTAVAQSYTMPERSDFLDSLDGKAIDLFILKNGNIQAAITNYGGRLVGLWVPDKYGNRVDVIVGPGTAKSFIESSEPYFGATIGRYGNRIAKGSFSIDGKKYLLDVNNGANTLHGGKKGFHNQVWDGKQSNDSTLVLTYVSKDGEQGFPGNLKVNVVYTLTAQNALQIEYEATTDKKTVCNLTNHAFFNLNGSGYIGEHTLQINSDYYTPIDEGLIPLGKNETVAATPFDFRTPTRIGLRVNDTTNAQLKMGLGYDHNFVLNRKQDATLQQAAVVQGDKSGIVMEVYTQEPGLQFYSGNFMKSKNIIKGGGKDDYRTAFCLETQHFPDSPNHANFPSTVLKPGEVYKTKSVYRFSVIE